MTFKRLASLPLLLICLIVPWASAQSVAPNGTSYTPAGVLEGYRWVSNAEAVFADENAIERAGQLDWETETPLTCKQACDAFLSCKAFQFKEPTLKIETPTCRLLSGATDLSVSKGTHIYIVR